LATPGARLGFAAVGYYAKHIEQQKALIDAAFAKLKAWCCTVEPIRSEHRKMSMVEVKVPQLSESVSEATLLQWKKKAASASSSTKC